MRILPADQEGALDEAVRVIREGGIVAHPTETCYGLACHLTSAKAVDRLFNLKERPTHKLVSTLFASVDAAKKYVEWNAKAEELAEKYLPGPLTIILPLKVPLHGWATLGVRISSSPFVQKLVKLAGVPLSTTSANIHGQPNPYSAADVVAQFTEKSLQPDLILDGGELPLAPPSTVVVVGGGEVRVLRQGDLVIS